jgi:hypothetical protein
VATFSEIRDRIRVVGERAEGVTVIVNPAETPPAIATGHAALVIQEPTASFAEGESRRGLDQWDVPLLLLASFGDYSLVPDALEPYLTRTGPTSIRQAFAGDQSLGLLDGTRAYLDRADEYGPRASSDGTRLAGVVLHLVVRTSG